jgi:hypothetical protein
MKLYTETRPICKRVDKEADKVDKQAELAGKYC